MYRDWYDCDACIHCRDRLLLYTYFDFSASFGTQFLVRFEQGGYYPGARLSSVLGLRGKRKGVSAKINEVIFG